MSVCNGRMIAPVTVVTIGKRYRSFSVLGEALRILWKMWRKQFFEKSYGRFSVCPRSILLLVRSVRNLTAFSLDPAVWSIASSSMYEACTAPACGRELSFAGAYMRNRTGETRDSRGSPGK